MQTGGERRKRMKEDDRGERKAKEREKTEMSREGAFESGEMGGGGGGDGEMIGGDVT